MLINLLYPTRFCMYEYRRCSERVQAEKVTAFMPHSGTHSSLLTAALVLVYL